MRNTLIQTLSKAYLHRKVYSEIHREMLIPSFSMIFHLKTRPYKRGKLHSFIWFAIRAFASLKFGQILDPPHSSL